MKKMGKLDNLLDDWIKTAKELSEVSNSLTLSILKRLSEVERKVNLLIKYVGQEEEKLEEKDDGKNRQNNQ